MRICVLGPLTVDGVTAAAGPRDRVVLEALALRHGTVASAEQLADALWPDLPPPSWNKVVHGCVMRLRRLLGTETIETTPQGYRLSVPFDDVDAYRFIRLAARGRELLTLGDPERARNTLADSLALWRGRPYADLENWDPARIESRRLEELRLDAEELAVEAGLLTGRHGEVLAEAQAAAYRDPMRERRWALLARAEYQSGRQAEALQTLHRARSLLIGEAGLDPGPELADLESAILRQDPSLTALPTATEPSMRCPYLGLVPYGIEDSEAFFGRERVVDECLGILGAEHVLAVVGPSGSGKSSVIRAGVAAALVRQGYRVEIVTPTAAHPSDALTAVPSDPTVVLVVDQCETALLGDEPAEALEFLDRVTALANERRVVLAMRADRLGDVSGHAGFARLVERGLHLLGAMDESELRQAIEEPAHQAGLLLEAGLVDLLVREVEGEPGALPLLSHALRQTWGRREGAVLTVDGYHATGGLRSAVAQSAERLYDGLGEQQRSAVRDLMLRLVAPTPEGDPVRSPIPRRLLASDRQHDRVIEMLVDSRLVTSDGATVELAHEALIRAWPRLRTWLDDDVDGQRILRHLTLAADGWERMGRPESELYRGVRLRAALDWRDRAMPTLTPVETDFLDSGWAADQEASHAAERHARHQARVNRQLRALLVGTAALLVVALVAGSVAVVSANRSRTAAIAAEAAQGRALAAASLNVLDEDRSLALLLAVEAENRASSTASRRALLSALYAPAFSHTTIPTPAPDYIALAVDDAGELAVGKRADGALDVIDLRKRSVRFAGLRSPPSPIEGVNIDASGSLVVSAGLSNGDASVVVYDLETGEEVTSFSGAPGEYYWAAFSPDGDDLAIADGRGKIRLYNVGTWRQHDVLDVGVRDAAVATIKYAPAGNRLYVATFDATDSGGPATLTAFDTESSRRTAGPMATDEQIISSIEVLPGGDEIAGAGRRIQRFSADSLEAVGSAFGPTEVEGLVSLAASKDGTLVAGSPIEMQVFGGAGTARPQEIETFQRGSPGVAFLPDSHELVTSDIDGEVSTWSVSATNDLGTPLRPAGPGLVSASPDGSVLAVWGEGREVQLYDRRSLDHLGVLAVGPGRSLTGVDFSPDGTRVVTMSCPRDVDPCPGRMAVWDVNSQERLAGPAEVGAVWAFAENGVVFVDEGTEVATAGADGTVRIWDATTLDATPLQMVASDDTPLPGGPLFSVAATDVSGRSMVAAQDDLGQTVVWELSGDEATAIGSLGNALRVGFTPDGRVITSTGPGAFVFRDPRTLQPAGPAFPSTVPPTSYSFSDPDLSDRTVMSSSGGLGTMLWDYDTGQPMSGIIPGFRSVLAPDGDTIYLGAGPVGDVVRAVSLRPGDLVVEACERAGRNLTEAEWASVIGTDEARRATCPEWSL